MRRQALLKLASPRTYLRLCTVKNAMREWTGILSKASVPEAKESTLNIMAHVLKKKQFAEVHRCSERFLTTYEHRVFQKLCTKRLHRMPVQYIIGEWDFLGMTLKMEPPVFIPRPETEQLAILVIERSVCFLKQQTDPVVLEIGCGTGAISLALLKACQEVKCVAIDQNPKACSLTEFNARKLGLSKHLQVLNARLTEQGIDINLPYSHFDIIVSNPPYIPTPQTYSLDPEIRRFEDSAAYDGGLEGLDVIKNLITFSKKALKPLGCLLMEVALEHPEMLSQNFHYGTFRFPVFHKDFTERNRFIELVKERNYF